MMTEAWVAESGAKAVDEYAPYFLYFNNVLWHHGGNPPGQKANPMASGYVASSSYDYVRPENASEAVIDREKFARAQSARRRGKGRERRACVRQRQGGHRAADRAGRGGRREQAA